VLFLRECHRILAPRGELAIKTPHWSHRDAFTDPTHKRFPTEHTFDYWVRGTVLWQHHNKAYGGFYFDRPRPPIINNGAMYVHLIKP
jgi:SAM-dependent methyltransferase